ncbi:hypothetical protein [Jannaschia aquimarina]|uniref:B12 binding domain protein n=1 Tax=Jannaschia aquimarina TaxID=935700 RepID=A0A0D1ED96_9RHOB|nr:hypothetical protein [Jannaschia aquimarina]KIT14891.1 hypothetical protein jaqu_32160 [Jannaschia aquimarina]SNS58568.1 hypothetical protein SAMN05421775_101541 [Jannaschia aquimarina]
MYDLTWDDRPPPIALRSLAALRENIRGARADARLAVEFRPLLLDESEMPWRAFVRQAAREGFGDRLLDAIAPAAADLGDDWMQDRLSFVDVSIGSSRLQDALRQLAGQTMRRAAGPAIPILVPPWEQHVLAAHLAALRLARRGRRAPVLTGLSPAQAAAMPVVRQAPAILVSCSGSPGRARLPAYVSSLGSCLRSPVPILTGGPAEMDTGPRPLHSRERKDPVAALEACGLRFDDLGDAPG